MRSRVNGNEIFLPAAGLMAGDKLCLAGEMGYYLSSTIKENPTGAAESINIIVNLLNVVYYINRWQNVIFMGFLYGKANIYNQG